MGDKLAHATYILSETEHQASAGADYAFLASPLTEPWNIAILVSVAAFVASLVYAGHRVPSIRDRIRFFRGRARSYQEFLPLILRFSIGVALVGAGTQGHLISPAVLADHSVFAVIQVTLGLLLIAGLATFPAALCTLVFTLGSSIFYPSLFHHFEIVGAAAAFLAYSQAKPSLDDLLGINMLQMPETIKASAPLFLRLGVGIPLVFSAVRTTILNPHIFGTYVEHIGLTHIIPLSTEMWVLSAAIVELALAAHLIFGFHARIASLIAFLLINASFYFIGESVYAHVALLGSFFVLMITGAGSYSLDDRYAKRRQQYQKA